ncbi:MAG: 3-dehydro-L-gulonate 2-dehydrogenase [Clostridia bacterium]
MFRVKYEEMAKEFKRVLISRGFDEQSATEAAEIFANNSLDGIESHGLNRFPVVVGVLDAGGIKPDAIATCEAKMGAIEKWDGHRGFGPLNAKKAMARACELAHEFGIGMVALGNNNHWMRGGSYGRQAADDGCIGICWSNTMPNMPTWGGVENIVGNNPIVFSVPKSDGNHVVVDCALSQFSYGKLETTRLKGEQLPVIGGYDQAGNLTTDPGEIEITRRPIPMGYWKGSGISILLDMVGAVLSEGHSVPQVGELGSEVGLTQIMIAIDANKFHNQQMTDDIINGIITSLKSVTPSEEGGEVRYPGEREFRHRKDGLENGVPANEDKWNSVLAM